MSKITKDEVHRFTEEDSPFGKHYGFAVETLGDGHAVVRLPMKAEHAREGGTVAGPVLFAAADYAMYVAILTMRPDAFSAVTANLNINFLRRPPAKDVIADCRVMKLGKRFSFIEATLFSDGMDEPVAHATGSYVLPPPPDT